MTEDRVRGFPAFPRLARAPRRFARSWWGNAWLTALEDTSLDPEPLRRGRVYARTGHVGPITVSPGRIAAPVYGDDGTPYRTAVHVEQLTDREWGRFRDEIAVKVGHIAALLDRQMPHDLVEAAADAGVRLLPGLGDLEPECDCPGWELPCTHAAALCYQAAWLLDDDPFVLFLLRGRGERELLDETTWRNVSVGRARQDATRAATAEDSRSMVRPSTPSQRGRTWPAVPPAPGVDPSALELLVADAAGRARELLAAGSAAEPAAPAAPPPALDLWHDTVRLAATYREAWVFERLQRASGRSTEELALAVRAWEHGGAAGLDVLETAWSPPPEDLAGAPAAFAAVWENAKLDDPPQLDVWRNRLTVTGHGVQLRYGRDGAWYPYREASGDWWPAGPGSPDPAAAVEDLLGK